MAGAITVCYSISGREDAPAVSQKTHDLRVLQEGGFGKVSGEIVTEDKNIKVIRCGPDDQPMHSFPHCNESRLSIIYPIIVEMEDPHESFGDSGSHLFSKKIEE